MVMFIIIIIIIITITIIIMFTHYYKDAPIVPLRQPPMRYGTDEPPTPLVLTSFVPLRQPLIAINHSYQ